MVVGQSEEVSISVWIAKDAPSQQAREVILALSGAGDESGTEPWCCPGCSEQIEPHFTECWKCVTAHCNPSCGEDGG
jgi:hypothetical protein